MIAGNNKSSSPAYIQILRFAALQQHSTTERVRLPVIASYQGEGT